MTGSFLPEAWPRWLRIEQACAYLGGIGEATFRKICPVAPLDMGANVLLYRRAEIDAWELSLPHRLPRNADPAQSAEPVPQPAANDRPMSAVERARARAAGKR